MYKFEDALFTENDVIQRAQEKGMTMDEYLSQNPEIIKVDEGKENDTATTDTASVSDTVSTLENGSLESQDPSKAFAAYTLQTNPSQQQINDVDSLFSDISIFDIQEKKEAVFNPKSDKFTYKTSKILPYEDLLTKIQEDLGPEANKDQISEKALEKLRSDELAKIKKQNQVDFLESLEDGEIPPLTAEYWKEVGQLPLDPSELKQYITKGGEKYNKDYSIALDNVYNVVEESNSLIKDLNKYNDKFESGEQITQEEQEDYLTKYNSLNSLQEDYNKATDDLGYYAIDIKDSSAQLALLKKNYDDLEKFGVSTLLAFKDFGAKAAYGLSVKLEPESRNLLRTLQLKEVLDNSNAIRQKYSEDVSFDDAFKDVTSFGKYSHQLLANQLPILASLSIPGGWTALLESSFGDRYKEMSIEDLNKKDFNEEERTKLKKFVEAYSYAIPEVALDRLTTGVRLKTIGQAFTGPERELFKRGFTESLQRGAFDTTIDSAAGGFSEGLTQVIQNKLTGKSIMEGVAEATFSGVYFDGVLSSVPAIKGMVMSSLSDVDAYKEVRYIQGKIESLEALQKSDNVKRDYSNDIKQLEKQRDSKIRKIEAEIKGTDGNLGMSVSASDLYVKTTAAQESIRKQAQDIVNSKLSQANKDSELKELKLKFDFLESNRKSYLKEKGSGYVLLDQENKQKYIDKALKRAKDKNTVIKDGEIDGLARQEYDREDIENNLKAAKKNNLDDTIEVIRSEEEFNDFVNKNVDKISDKDKLNFTNAYKNGENGFAFDNKSVLLVENMAVNGRTKVRTHELFHILGSKAFNNDNTIFNGMANSIVEWTKANDEVAYKRLQRLVERKDGKLIADEVIAVFMEDVANNRIKLNNKKGLLSLLGFGTSKALKDAYGLNVDPAGIDDTVNLIYGIAKKIDAGTLTETDIEKLSGLEQSEALQKQGKRAVEDYMFATGEDFKKASKVQSKIDDLGNKYTRDEWVESGADETIGEIYTDLEGLISSKAFMLDRLPNFSKEDFITETLVQLIPHIRNFNIDKRKDQSDKFGLSGWINSQLMNKIGNVLKAKTATTETFSVDESADTFREIVATEDDLDLLEDEDLSLQAQLRKKQRDQKRAEKGLQVGVEYSKFRRELEINGQKGISDAMKKKVEDITLEILTSNKYINLNLDAVQKTLQRDFEVAIKKTIQDAMGGQNDYVQFLTRNMNTILRHMDISSLVAIERQVDSKDKIMTEFVRRLQTQKDVQDAIDNGWLSHIDNPAQGPYLYKVLKPSVADFIKFYSPSLRVESPKKVKQWNTMTDVAKQQFADGIGKTLEQARRQFVEVRSGLKGTRKDTLAERIAGQLAFDATMQVIQGNEFASLRAVQGKPVLAQGRIKEIARRIDRGIEVKFAKKGKMVTVTSGMINISSDLINDAVNRKSTIANEDSIDRTKYKYFEFNTEKGNEYFNTAVDIAQGILNDFRYESMSIKEDYRDEAIKKAIENNVQVFNNKKGKYKTANYMAEQMVIDGINPYFKNNQNVEIQPEPSGPTGVDIIIRHKKKDLELYYGLEKKMTTARGPVTSIQPVIENGKLNFYTGKKNPVLFDPNSIAVNPEDASQIEAMMQAAREKINALNSLFKSEGLPEFVDSYVDLTFAQIEAIATKSHKAFFNVGGLKSDNFTLSQDWLTQKYDNKKQKTSAIDIGTSGLKFLPSKNSTVTVMNNTVKRIFKEKTGIEIPTLNESMKAQMKFMVSTKGKITFVLEQKIEGNSMSASPAQLSKKLHRKAFAEATSAALNQQAISKASQGEIVFNKVKFAKSMNQSINEMINRSRGIPTDEVVSAAIAKRRGKNKNRFQVYIPPSAEDFVGLMYFIIGKGKQGDADLDFIKKSLIEPFSEAYTNLDSVRQAILTDIQALNKQLPELKKKLNDTMPNSEFTFDNAIRVYLYNKHGHNVPGISTEENSNLVSRVLADEELLVYAESLDLFSKTEAWLEPGEYWTAGSTVSDINRIVEGFHRKEFLKDWIENKDEIFSKDNMNKLEAAYGSNYRSALEDMLYRMETGVSRPSGKNKINNQFTNWLNNSVGAIMFFNVKSALLQTLSTVNYLNFEDNNIFAAGKAFANQPQYWSDFTMIFNSDFLKNRRSGIKTDVSLSEIASNVAQAGNKAKAAMAYLLKVGFTPTQIADSFAIASGGATYYRNRVNKYIKEGKSKTEAEKQAFIDFREVTEETQQSARPDRVSQQQTSDAGRLILAFQNAPMQFNRIIKKAALDLANNRGDYRANISRIVYYGGIQSLIFTAMQNALFALAFDDEDESKLTAKEIEKKQKFETKKYERIVNSMIDTILRGSGIAGAVIATIKNTSIKFITEDEGVLVEALQLSPQIGSKARKILKGKRSFKWDGEAIGLMSKFDTKNTIWAISTPIIEATTNVPLNRLLNKVNNLREATDSTNSAWQRAAMALGWSAWDLGVDPSTEVKEAIKKGKEQGLIKGKGTAKPCLAVKSDGTPCRNMTTNKNRLCYLHD